MKKRSSSVNKGFLWAHALFVRIINMEGGVTIEEVNCKLPLNYYTLQICTMYIVGLFYQCKTMLSFNIMRSLGHRFYKLWQLQSAALSSPAFILCAKNEICLLSRTSLNITTYLKNNMTEVPLWVISSSMCEEGDDCWLLSVLISAGFSATAEGNW